MRYDCAPMEGVTGVVFRQVHHRHFPGVDQYHAPFLSPTKDHVFTHRERREIGREANTGIPVVPQLLTRRAEDFLWAAEALFDLGYPQVELNLGCPSGTVTAKGKGSGFLRDREGLEAFLDEVFAKVTGPVSIKTRLGLEDPEEFWPLLALYGRYPLAELILHPRVRADQYRHPVRREVLPRVLEEWKRPLCYNGDLDTPADIAALERDWPQIGAVMLGRGLAADPALIRARKGGPPLERAELRSFVDDLYDGYSAAFGSRRSAMSRMKELWAYLLCRFGDHEKAAKRLRTARDTAEYEETVARIFGELPLLPETRPEW